MRFVIDWVDRCHLSTNCTTLGEYHHEVMRSGTFGTGERSWTSPITGPGSLFWTEFEAFPKFKGYKCVFRKYWTVAVNRFGIATAEPGVYGFSSTSCPTKEH